MWEVGLISVDTAFVASSNVLRNLETDSNLLHSSSFGECSTF
jgi:hypothetical protein